jgi:hypothetical protein
MVLRPITQLMYSQLGSTLTVGDEGRHDVGTTSNWNDTVRATLCECWVNVRQTCVGVTVRGPLQSPHAPPKLST